MTQEEKRAERRHRLEKLIANPDFEWWIGRVLDEFCAFDQGFGRVDEFHQGIRAAASWIVQSLREGEGAADMLSRIYRKTILTTKPKGHDA